MPIVVDDRGALDRIHRAEREDGLLLLRELAIGWKHERPRLALALHWLRHVASLRVLGKLAPDPTRYTLNWVAEIETD